MTNANLAKYCDEWGLYSCRIDRVQQVPSDGTKTETIEHVKGTLVESIMGVIYEEFGLGKLLDIVPHIQ